MCEIITYLKFILRDLKQVFSLNITYFPCNTYAEMFISN
jgi:hypothetical protein